MNKRVRNITEGSMMVAIVGAALLINRQFAGLLEYALYWVLTFPILIYTIRYGMKDAIVVSVCMILISFMLSLPTTIFYLAISLVIGLVYGDGVRKKWSNTKLLWVTGIFTFFSYVITTVVFAEFFGYDPMEDVELLTSMLNTFQIQGVAIGELLKVYTILSTVLLSVMQTFCIHLLAFVLMKRLKMETLPMKNVFDFKAPKALGYCSIIIWVLFFTRNMVKLNIDLSIWILCLWMVMFIITLAYGCLSIMGLLALSGKKNWVYALIILIFVPIINYAISFLGIYDMCCGFRAKLKRG